MNYYKQGDAANADKIKAAFEAKGYHTGSWDYGDELFFFFSMNNGYIRAQRLPASNKDYEACLIDIIKTHPDYQELELPVEPKFAIGQIICPTAESDLRPVNVEVIGVDVDKQRYTIKQKGYAASTLPFKFQDRYTLMYIQSKPHYDIANFHEGMPVLVRDDENDEWRYVQFSHVRMRYNFKFVAGAAAWKQCIPFNEDTKYLLGTTDMPNEEYINW